MKKRYSFLFVFVILLLLPTAVFSADKQGNQRIYGAEFKSASDFAPVKGGDNSISAFSKIADGTRVGVTYSVQVETAGYYKLKVVGDIGGLNASPCTFSVNDGEEMVDDVARENVFGPFYFQAGLNTVNFTLTGCRGLDSNYYMKLFFIDLVPVRGWRVDTASLDGVGVYEEGEAVSVMLTASMPSDKANRCRYTVYDYWGSAVASVEFDFKPDTLRQRISLGKDFLCGWYSVKIAQSEEKVNFAEASFAVMPHTVKADFKTPFGVDFFSSYQGFSATRRQAYIKALKQMGVSSVRERVYWPAVEPQRGEWDFYGPDRVFEPLKQDGFEIMSVYSGTPDWASNVKGVGDGPVNNLFDVYNSSKKLAQYYDGKVNAWEILNEPDTNAQVPLDIYAAFMKTAAVGIVDSGAKAKKIGASWALYPELGGNFAGISLEGIYANGIDLALQNDVAKYSDAYNIHTYYEVDDTISDDYTILLNRKVIDGRLDVKRAYDTSNKMVYMTETGASFPADANIKKAQHADARAIVTGTVNQLANDVDRIWWFSMVSQIENGREFGMFSPYHMPYPKYVAAAVLVKTLKKAECIGMLNHLPHGACGAVFNTGTGNTAVLWSEKTQNVSLHCDNAVVLTDIMGHTTKLDSVNGTVSFSVGKDPVYVDLQGAMCYCNYKALDYAENDESSQTLDKTQRVVLLQRYGVGNEKDTWAKATKAGYQFENGLPQAVYLDIYNFNHETISGTLKTKVTGGFTVSGLPQSFTVAPMSKVTLPMTVSVDGAVQGDMNSVTVLASCGVGGETKSVARVIKASSDGSYKSLLQQKIKLNGISENAVLKSSSATCMAQLSTGVEPGSTKVYLMGREVPYELEGRTVKIQLDGLENGCYKLLVTAHTDDGYAVRASVQFYIEE